MVDADVDDEPNDEDAKTFRNNDKEEDNAVPAPENAPPNALQPVDNKDGTTAVYLEGTRVGSERLSRGMVQSWVRQKHIDIPSTCCEGSDQECDGYHRHHHRSPNNVREEEEQEDVAGKETGEEDVDFNSDMEPEVFEED
jgi:hypothetical protein